MDIAVLTESSQVKGILLLLQPATVSRCGMIYLEPSQLGWEPLVASWLNSLKEPLNEPEHQTLLKELFKWLVPPSLAFRRKKCKVTNSTIIL